MTKEEFKAERKRKKLNQRELATFLGASYSAVTKWEIGVNEIPHWVEEKMRDRRKGFVVDDLSAAEIAEFEKKAASKGTSSDKLAAEVIRMFLKLSVVCLIARYAFDLVMRK